MCSRAWWTLSIQASNDEHVVLTRDGVVLCTLMSHRHGEHVSLIFDVIRKVRLQLHSSNCYFDHRTNQRWVISSIRLVHSHTEKKSWAVTSISLALFANNALGFVKLCSYYRRFIRIYRQLLLRSRSCNKMT